MTRDSDLFRFSRVDFRDEFKKTIVLQLRCIYILFHFILFFITNPKGYDW